MKKRRSRKYIAVILAAVMTLSMVGYPGMVNAKEIDVLEESSPEKALTSEMEDQPEIQPEPVTLAEPEVQPEPTVTPEPENEPEPTTPLEPETPPEPTTPPESVTPSEPEPTAQPEESSAPAPTPPSEPQESTPEPAEPSETEIPGKDQPEAEKPQEAVTPTPVPEKKNTGKKKNVQKKASTQAGKDIPAGTRVDENREEINNNYGYIEFNFGTIKNNQGTVEHNFGKINENNGVIEENYITFEHGIQPSGTVGSIRKQYYEVNVDMSSIITASYIEYYNDKCWVRESSTFGLKTSQKVMTVQNTGAINEGTATITKYGDGYVLRNITGPLTLEIKWITPNISIDYINEQFVMPPNYYIYAMRFPDNSEETISYFSSNIKDEWMGKTVQIYFSDDTSREGTPQTLTIPPRPAALQITQNDIQATASSITLPSNTNWEYRIDNGNWTSSNKFENLKANKSYNIEVRSKSTSTGFASVPTSITVTTAPATYTVSIPSTATSGGNISIYFDQTNPPDLGYNGKVTVKNETSDTVMDQNGNLQLTRSDQSYNVSLQLLKSDNTPLQRGETVTELQTLSDAETLTLTTPTAAFDQNGQQVADNQIPAGTYKGTLNFSISYSD